MEVRKAATALVVLLMAACAGESEAPSPELLPDLDQAPPAAISVVVREGRERLVFLSAVENVGAGPLLVAGLLLGEALHQFQRQEIERGLGTKIGFLLGLVGIYTFAFGLLSATEVFKQVPGMGEDLTSPNPTRFLAGIAEAMALLSMAFAVAVDPIRTHESLNRRGGMLLLLLTQVPLMTVGFLVVTAFIIIYVVVIAPLAWLGYMVASAPLDSILGASRDMNFTTISGETGEETSLSVQEFVDDNLVTLRNLLVAIPSLVSSLILDAPDLL